MRRLFANPAFLRLWAVGGVANAARWVEILVAAVYTFQVTHSAFAVSLILMMRSLPMLLGGALAGAVAEVLDRRRLLMAGQALTATSACTITLLALCGWLEVWHLGVSGLISGLVWTGEMASRRRMLTEAAGERDMVQGVALDGMTANTTRMAGPLIGGLLLETLGLAAAYALSAGGALLALLLLSGVRHSQAPGRIRPRQILADIADAVRVVRRYRVLTIVILVTIAVNIFGFCFNTVLPALGSEAYGATPFQVGILTASEPAGALLTGLLLASRRGAPLRPGLMIAGSAFFMLCLLLLPLMPALWLASGMLLLAGIGTALFSALQTALSVTEAPPEARSRVLGLVTTCIGMGPVGVLTIGALADALGPERAIPAMASAGLATLAVTGLLFRPGRREGFGRRR
jgi:MFS family permease